MARSFVLNMEILARASGNIATVINQIRSQFKDIKVDVQINVPKAAEASLKGINTQLTLLHANLTAISGAGANLPVVFANISGNAQRAAQNISNTGQTARTSAQAFKAFTEAAKEADSSLDYFGKQAGLAARRFSAFIIASGTMFTLFRAIKDGATASYEFERNMIRLSQVSEESADKVRSVGEEVRRLAITYGVSSAELLKAGITIKQAGFSIDDTKKSLEALAKASLAPNFGNMEQTAETLIALFGQFGITADKFESKLGSINAVATAFAVEADDLSEAIKRTGGAFAATGGNMEELLALFTAVRSTTRESAETIATSLRTIFSRIQRAETIEQLRGLGVELRRTREEASLLGNVNLEGQFVGGYEAIKRIGEALKGIPGTDPRFSTIVEEIGGVRQVSKVIPLLQQQELSQKALNVARQGDISLTKDADKAQDGFLNKLIKVREEFTKLIDKFAQSDQIKKISDGFLQFANTLVTVLDKLQPVVSSLAFIGTFKAIGSLASFGGGFASGIIPRAKFAKGDLVDGPSGVDQVPAMLTKGEYIIKEPSARRLGLARLKYMNERGEIPGFNMGGAVAPYRLHMVDGGGVDPDYIRRQHEFIQRYVRNDQSPHFLTLLSEMKREGLYKGTFKGETYRNDPEVAGLRKAFEGEKKSFIGYRDRPQGYAELGVAHGLKAAAAAAGVAPQPFSPTGLTSVSIGAFAPPTTSTINIGGVAPVISVPPPLPIPNVPVVLPISSQSQLPFWMRQPQAYRPPPPISVAGPSPTLGERFQEKEVVNTRTYSDRLSPEGVPIDYYRGKHEDLERRKNEARFGGIRAAYRVRSPEIQIGEPLAPVAESLISVPPPVPQRPLPLSSLPVIERSQGVSLYDLATGNPRVDRYAGEDARRTEQGGLLNVPTRDVSATGKTLQTSDYDDTLLNYKKREAQARAIVASNEKLTDSRLTLLASQKEASEFARRQVFGTGIGTGQQRELFGESEDAGPPPSIPPVNPQPTPPSTPPLIDNNYIRQRIISNLAKNRGLSPDKAAEYYDKINNTYFSVRDKHKYFLDEKKKYVDAIDDAIATGLSREQATSLVDNSSPARVQKADLFSVARKQRRREERAEFLTPASPFKDDVLPLFPGIRDDSQRNLPAPPPPVQKGLFDNLPKGYSSLSAHEAVKQLLSQRPDFAASPFQNEIAAGRLGDDKTKVLIEKSIRQQVSALDKNLSAIDRETIVRGKLKEVLEGTNKLVITNNKLLGEEGLHSQLEGQGISTKGVALRGRFADVGDAVRSAFTPVNPRISQGIFGATIAASYFQEGIAREAGRPVAKAISGGLTEATIASSLGGGAPGIIAGLITGGLQGFLEGRKDEAKTTLDKSIGDNLNNLNSQLSNALARGGSVGGADAATISNILKQSRADIYERASFDEGSRGTGAFKSGFIDPEGFKKNIDRRERELLVPLIPQFAQILGVSAREIGGKTKEDLFSTNSEKQAAALDRITKTFENANNGFNKIALSNISQVRGLPQSEVLQQFVKEDLISAARNKLVQDSNEKNTSIINKTIANFSLLTDVVHAASIAAGAFASSINNAEQIFGGQYGATKVAGNSESLFFGNPDQEAFRKAISLTTSPLGPQGDRLRDLSVIANEVTAVLPVAIANAVKGGFATGERPLGPTIRENILTSLGKNVEQYNKNPNPDLDVIIADVQRNIEKLNKDPGDFTKKVGLDLGGITKELTKDIEDPLSQASQAIAKRFEDRANEFSNAIARQSQRLAQLGAERDKIEVAGLASLRNSVGERLRLAGRPGDIDRAISLQQDLVPFVARQERLSGLQGKDALNPKAIAARIDSLKVPIAAAEKEVANAAPQSKAQDNALIALQGLKDESIKAREALKHLAESGERVSLIQERLNRINQDRESRLSFGERFIGADLGERARLARGLQLIQVARVTGIDKLAQPDQKLVLDTLNSLGNARIFGTLAKDIKDNLLSAVHGGVLGLEPGTKAEDESLRAERQKVLEVAKQAQELYVKSQTDLNDDMRKKIIEGNDVFVKNLGTLLQSIDKKFLVGDLGAKSKEGETLLKRQQAFEGLAQYGITTPEQIKAVTSGKFEEAIQNYRKVTAQLAEANPEEKLGKFDDILNEVLAQHHLTNVASGEDRSESLNLHVRLAQRHIIDENSILAQKELEKRINNDPSFKDSVVPGLLSRYRIRESGFGRTPVTPEKISELRDQLYQQFVRDRDELNKQRSKEAVKVSSLFPGSNPQSIGPVLDAFANEKTAKILKAQAELVSIGENAENTAKSLKNFNEQIFQLNLRLQSNIPLSATQTNAQRAIRNIGDTARVGQSPPGFFANGGNVFKPHGTDVIPAMLSPNEFVVNAKSAQANRTLLESVNNARGPLYLADGGEIPPYAKFAQRFQRFYGVTQRAEKAPAELRSIVEGLSDPQLNELYQRAFAYQSAYLRDRRTATNEIYSNIAYTRKHPGEKENSFQSITDRLVELRDSGANRDSKIKLVLELPENARNLAVLQTQFGQFQNQGGGVFNQVQPQGKQAVQLAKVRVNNQGKGQIVPDERGQLLNYLRPELEPVESYLDQQYRTLLESISANNVEVTTAGFSGNPRFDVTKTIVGDEEQQAELLDKISGIQRRRSAIRALKNSIPQDKLLRNVLHEWLISAKNLNESDGLFDLIDRGEKESKAFNLYESLYSPVKRFAHGGFVGGTGGTDSQLARLTPGEFVMTPEATKAIGANNLAKANYFAKGGLVGGTRASTGGLRLVSNEDEGFKLPPEVLSAFNNLTGSLATFATNFANDSKLLGAALNGFNTSSTILAQSLDRFPRSVEMNGKHVHEVIFNGAEVFANIMPALQTMVKATAQEQIEKAFKQHLPDLPVAFHETP